MDLRLWFGVKYATGILVLTVVLGIPALIAGLTSPSATQVFEGHLSRAVLATLWLWWLYATVYSLTMLFYCLLRQPVYAVVLTLLSLWLGAYVCSELISYPPYPWATYTVAAVLTLASIVVLTWKSFQYDWGWK